MHPPGTETESLRDLQKEDLEKGVDYESATVFVGLNGSLLTTITGEDDTSCAPSPFVMEWKSQNICFVSNSPLAPDDKLTKGVPRFRVQSLLHLVYPSVGQVALFLVDLGRC